jgi:hypothetical protein
VLRRVVIIIAVLCAAALAAAPARAANVFDGAGVFIDNPGDFPGPTALADELQRDHFSWVAFHAHNGIWVSWGVPQDWIDALRSRGISVGLWGWEDSSPQLSAELAAFQVRQVHADFYIADAEWDYERARHSAGWYRSQLFVNAFRQYEPNLPAALTTFGAAPAPWVLPIDFAAWRNGGFDFLPQAYFNQFPKVDRPDMTVAHAARAGWSLDRVHPVIGVYHKYPAANYVPLLRAAGTTGYSLFLADQATAADYQALSVLNGG